MKKKDLSRMCIQNLRRRKSRTLLTVLGVVIGCCSIAIMVSIGIGMKESEEQSLREMGDLTQITVTQPMNGGEKYKVDENLAEEIRRMDGVTAVTPKKSLQNAAVKLYAGAGNRYTAEDVTITGIDMEQLDSVGYTASEGSLENLSSGKILVGEDFAYSFADTMRPEGSNTVFACSSDGSAAEPWFDPVGETITVEVSSADSTGAAQTVTAGGEEADSSGSSVPAETLKLVPAAVTEGDYSKDETVSSVIMDLSDLQDLMRQLNMDSSKIRQYDALRVKVSDISKVEQVENSIRNLGYNTDSLASIRESMEKESRHVQMMLAGLGAISLFVAALGIMNTMIMAISERTREIGIMKSLGCYVKDIRFMFLTEAGLIGLLGGIAGCTLSFLISTGINLAAMGGISSANLIAAIAGGEGITRLSIIPLWLYGFAIFFSVMIGIVSGLYPAEKAVRIPALEAIKSE